jgi:hypothetical protein
MQTKDQMFRAAFLPVFLFFCIGFSLVTLPSLAIYEMVRWGRIDLRATLAGIVASFILLLICVFVERRRHPVQVDASGLHGYSPAGARRFITWHDIEVIGPFQVFNLRWLRLASKSSADRLWLPLFLRDRPDFCRRVETLAPASCPLLKYVCDA